MPAWLNAISHLSPLPYLVNALRTSMVASGTITIGIGMDYAVILFATIELASAGAQLYPQLGV
jgi:hypothetical protein